MTEKEMRGQAGCFGEYSPDFEVCKTYIERGDPICISCREKTMNSLDYIVGVNVSGKEA